MAVPAPTTSAAIRTALRSIAFLAVAACASGPNLARVVTVQEGSPTTAQLVSTSAGTRRVFTLRNLSSVGDGEDSQAPQLKPLTKVLPDELMQELLDHFTDQGLFEGAGRQIPANTGSAILVSSGGRQFVLHAAGAAADRRQAYLEASALYLNLFNRVSGYQARDVRDSSTDLKRIRMLKDLIRAGSGGRGQ